MTGLSHVFGQFWALRLEPPAPYDPVNIYVRVEQDGSFLLIDAGPRANSCLSQLRATLEEAGLSLSKLEAVLLTHCHVDHAGLAGELQRLTGCDVLVHPADLQYVVDPARKMAERLNKVLGELDDPDIKRMVEEALSLGLGRGGLAKHFSSVEPEALGETAPGGLRVLEAPGHTAGSVVYLAQEFSAGFSGDTVLDTLTLAIEDLGAYLSTLEKLLSCRIDALWPGHGSPLRPASAWVGALKQKYLGRAKRVAEIISEPKTLLEVAKTLYAGVVDWSSAQAVRANPVLALAQTKTYLDYLVAQGAAQQKTIGGRTHYVSSRVFLGDKQ